MGPVGPGPHTCPGPTGPYQPRRHHWFQVVVPELLEPVVQVLVVVVVGAASPFVSTIQSVLSDQGSGRSTC